MLAQRGQTSQSRDISVGISSCLTLVVAGHLGQTETQESASLLDRQVVKRTTRMRASEVCVRVGEWVRNE